VKAAYNSRYDVKAVYKMLERPRRRSISLAFPVITDPPALNSQLQPIVSTP
jgi:hypothetical protein